MEISLGIEKILAMAAVDDNFAEVLLTKREETIAASDVRLTELEKTTLLSAPETMLEEMIKTVRKRIPDEDRRNFLKQSASAVLKGLVTTGVIMTALAVTLPSLGHTIERANEMRTISHLKTLGYAQEYFIKTALVDQNQNGKGEYGLFNELCGATDLRDHKGGHSRPALTTTDISMVYCTIYPKGTAKRSGYFFKIFLPHVDQVVSDKTLNLPDENNKTAKNSNQDDKSIKEESVGVNGSKDPASIRQQEKKFIIYAWPVNYPKGKRCFVTDQSKKVYAASNIQKDGRVVYNGEKGPAFNAAMDKSIGKITTLNWNPIAIDNVNAVDGQLWSTIES